MGEEFKNRLYKYVIRLIKFLVAMPSDPVRREIVSQLTRSGTSIGANYFEAQGASSKRDYQNYFNHSLKSANESMFWLNAIYDAGLVPEQFSMDWKWLLDETKELSNIFASSILTMKKQKKN